MRMEPVAIWEGIAVRRVLTEVEDAALVLLHKWPPRHKGKKAHIAAQIAVLAPLEDTGTTEDARAEFVAAAKQADMLADLAGRPESTLPGHVARPWDMVPPQKRKAAITQEAPWLRGIGGACRATVATVDRLEAPSAPRPS